MTKAFLVACLYRPPTNNMEEIEKDLECIEMTVSEFTKTNRMYILMGDFNLKNHAYKKLINILKKYGASQLIKQNTRKDAMLDLFVTNRKEMCTNTNVTNLHIADHSAIFTTLRVMKPKNRSN